MGFSDMTDRMVWPPSLSRDRTWPRVTKCMHSRVVGLRLEGSLVLCCLVLAMNCSCIAKTRHILTHLSFLIFSTIFKYFQDFWFRLRTEIFLDFIHISRSVMCVFNVTTKVARLLIYSFNNLNEMNIANFLWHHLPFSKVKENVNVHRWCRSLTSTVYWQIAAISLSNLDCQACYHVSIDTVIFWIHDIDEVSILKIWNQLTSISYHTVYANA